MDSVPQWKKNKAKGWYGQVPANEMTVATAPKAFEDGLCDTNPPRDARR